MITALLQIIAGALLLNTPLIIMWVWLARKESKPKLAAQSESYASENFWS